MTEFKIDGRMTVRGLKDAFNKEFGGTLRVYKGKGKAEDTDRLAALRSEDGKSNGEFKCAGNLTVGGFKKRMMDIFGIKVEVATGDDFVLVLDSFQLNRISSIPKYATKEKMEAILKSVDEFKKQVEFEEYLIGQEEKGTVRVYKNGELCDVTSKALREIAEKIGFAYDAAWGPQILGVKLIDFLDNMGNSRENEQKPQEQGIECEQKLEMDVEELLKKLQSKRYELEEKCNEINQQLVETLRQYTEATGNETFSMAMDEEMAKEYLIAEYGYEEEDVEDPCDCGEVNYSDYTEYYYPHNESLMNFYITSLLEDEYIPLEYKFVRNIAEFAIDERSGDKIAVTRYFDDDGTEHESECEGFLLANPNIPETYMQIKAIIELIKQHF